jgi:cation diffusion facilitator CzcD-associated flavoprotein CzcO
LKEENVKVVFSGIQQFTKTGVITDIGSSHDGDVAICATGFDTSYVSRYSIYGPSGRNLQTEWAQLIMGYMGVGISEFPNTFTSR